MEVMLIIIKIIILEQKGKRGFLEKVKMVIHENIIYFLIYVYIKSLFFNNDTQFIIYF